jgi:hypothetical protein
MTGGFTHGFAQGIGHKRRRGLLGELLVTALNRTVPLGQMAYISVLISYNLNLDMTGFLDEFFHVHPSVSEGRRGLNNCTLEMLFQFFLGPNGAHTLSTTPRGSLDHYRIAHF